MERPSRKPDGTFKPGNPGGPGRPPKALADAQQLADAEQKIITARPVVIDALITAAKGGDVAAARYLLDRVFGRVTEQQRPPAEDNALPFTAEDAEMAAARKAEMNKLLG